MENNSNRRLLILIGLVIFFVILVLVWYFFYAKPIIAPGLKGPNDPLPVRTLPPRFQFLNWRDTTRATSTTEVIDPLSKPLIQIWNKPATGQTFIVQQILKEVLSTSTPQVSTTTTGTSTNRGTTTPFLVKKTERATSTIVMFVDRETGYLYGYPIETGIVYQITNSIYPGISDAHIFDNGKRIIMRYPNYDKNTINALVANIPNVSQNGTPLPLENIQSLTGEVTSVAVSSQKDKAAYVVGTSNGSTIYTIAQKGPIMVATSPFKEWNVSYGGDSLFVTSKASAYVEGATLSLPFFESEIAEKTGLLSIPSPNNTLLNSMWSKRGLVTFFIDQVGTKILPITTLAQKCAWGSGTYLACAVPRIIPRGTEGLPDDWYQGRISFSDDLFIIDTTLNEKFPLYTFTEEDGIFDVTNITLSKQNDLLTFNKHQDKTLWLLNTNLITAE